MLFPYKTLTKYEAEIRAELSRLETECPKIVRNAMVMSHGAVRQLERQATAVNKAWLEQVEEWKRDSSEKSEERPDEDEILSDFFKIAEVRILIELIDTKLKGVLAIRRQFREGTAKVISFWHLCFLFEIGDIVLATDSGKQAFKVFSTSGGILLDRAKALEYRQGSHHNELCTYNQHDVASPFIVDCYHLAFDCVTYGPVQKSFTIPYFSGSKPISLLPICPEIFDPNYQNLRKLLVERGRSFLEMVGDGQKLCMLCISS